MKRLIIIFSVLFLSAAPLLAKDGGQATQQASSGQEKALTHDAAGVIQALRVSTIVIGSKEYPFSRKLRCYSEDGNIISRTSLKVEDGVKYRLNEEGEVIYLKILRY